MGVIRVLGTAQLIDAFYLAFTAPVCQERPINATVLDSHQSIFKKIKWLRFAALAMGSAFCPGSLFV